MFSPGKSTIVLHGMEDLTLKAPIVLATETKFTDEVVEVGEKIPFKTESYFDENKDACSDDEVVQQGKPGKSTKKIRVIFYNGVEFMREDLNTHTEEPQTKIVKKGLKKIYKSMQTDSGIINYWCKLGEFVATAYDPKCHGCSTTTAIGMKAGFGVVAVDKDLIPLGSSLYITGYGRAIAGDTGSKIKGHRIDLGFDEIGNWWGKRKVEVYLL